MTEKYRRFDESHARVRPSGGTRPRSKDRPSHSDAVRAFVTTVDRGRITCVLENGDEITATTARELGRKSVVVGDYVGVVGDVSGKDGSLGRIVTIQERRNTLSRSIDDVAKVERTIVANIDQIVIVVAAANPEPRRGLIDRFLVCAFHENIQPVILITKIDIAAMPDFMSEYEVLGIPILQKSKDGSLKEIQDLLAEKKSVLVGHSGVGKSTLINQLIPAALRATGIVNESTGRGRHTSSSAIALPLEGTTSGSENSGWIIDTPGIRAFGLAHIDPERILGAFPELYEVSQTCMSNCSHQGSDCAIATWASAATGREGEIRIARLESLRTLLDTKLDVTLD